MKSNYHEKKAARIEHYENMAAGAESEFNSTYARAKQMADVIPFGQPIIVGHHSEGRDRRYRDKIHNTFGKAFAASRKAEYYRDKAESLLNNTAISSDNPDAIDLLKQKLEKLQDLQELMKACNTIVRNKKFSDVEKIEYLVQEVGIKESTATKLLTPDRLHGAGFPSYSLTNNSANIRRVKERIEHLERVASIQEEDIKINGVRLVVSQADNRVQLFFDGKPIEEVRKELKGMGFRWAPSVEAWQNYLNPWNIKRAKDYLQNRYITETGFPAGSINDEAARLAAHG